MKPSDLTKWAKEEMADAVRSCVREIAERDPEITFDEAQALEKQRDRVLRFLGVEEMKMHAPLDPDCPKVASLMDSDPMIRRWPTTSWSRFERKHRKSCPRCQQYGAANIEVE
jgi:hypothetical protein